MSLPFFFNIKNIFYILKFLMEDIISHHENNYIIDGIQEDLRNDGRSVLDYRPVTVDTGILPASNGSARVQIGATDVIVAIKAEVNSVEKGEPIVNRFKFFIDISANASPKFAGRGGNEFAEEMAKALYTAYDHENAVPEMHKLILSPTHFWTIYVDALILQYDGNAMDAISLAIKAALFDTEICNVIVRPADEGKVLIELPDESSSWRFNVTSAPLVVAVNKIGDQCVFDADSMEELCCTNILYVGVRPTTENVNDEHTLTCIKKVKGGSMEIESMVEMLEKGVNNAKKLNDALMMKLNSQQKHISNFIKRII